MCWSGEASAVLATIGLSTAVYSCVKKMPKVMWVTLGYFSLMELLQAFTYTVIDQCGSHLNQVLTLFGYLHIAFQPFFINAVSMYFLPAKKRALVMVPAYTICFAASIVMLMQLFPFEWAGVCVPREPLCASQLCSVSGNWHIAWDIPLNGFGVTVPIPFFSFHIGAYLLAYMLAGFVMPFAYGVWRGTIFHFVMGPMLAWLTTDNMNEWPAIWCLLSIGIVMMVIKVRMDPVIAARYFKNRPIPGEGLS